jgi:hypothetical protein
MTTFDNALSMYLGSEWAYRMEILFGLIRDQRYEVAERYAPIFKYWLGRDEYSEMVRQVGISLMATKSIWITISSTDSL